MTPRLASSVLVGALIRKAETEGGFGAVLAKGEPTSGSVLVILTERGGNPRILERILDAEGHYSWQSPMGGGSDDDAEVPRFVERRRRFDPDLWVLELDIPSRERFAADMNAIG
jgi:hypothetical protein